MRFLNLPKIAYIEAELIRLHNEANDYDFDSNIDSDRKEATIIFEAYKLIYAQIDKMNTALIEELSK
jgi:hypothetical protein